MRRTIVLLVPLTLVGCESSEGDRNSEAEKAATQDMLKGEAVKSPVLDYSRFDGPPPVGTPAEPAPTPSPPAKSDQSRKEPSGFKKSPVLDYSKF